MNPIDQITELLDQLKAKNLLAPVCLSTVDEQVHPHSRFVDLKEVTGGRLLFGTDERSTKAREFTNHPHVSMCAWWGSVPVQVRVLGTIERSDETASDRIFASRTKAARALANVSVPSSRIPHLDQLRSSVVALLADDSELARPPTWWVYGVVPHEIEILRFSDDRIHVRTRYVKTKDEWIAELLAP